MSAARGILVLEDGLVLSGRSVAAPGTALGEMVFNTSMTGYQEAVTDPSYSGQLLCFAAPQVGNYGVGERFMESDQVWPRGVVMTRAGNDPGTAGPTGWCDWLTSQGVVALDDLDTRRLVRHLRDKGAMRGGVSTEMDAEELLSAVRAHPTLDGRDLATPAARGRRTYGTDGPRVVAIDAGMKNSIAAGLVSRGCRLEVVPAGTTAEEILALDPDAVFISNGPGDPAAVTDVIDATKGVLGKVPLFGICLGHQMLALALGMGTEKLPFGHRGANHPVRRSEDGVVEVTVQNHGYAVVGDGARDGIEITRVSLFDHSVEGIAVPELRAHSVQYHPEGSPGPRDARYMFSQFIGGLR